MQQNIMELIKEQTNPVIIASIIKAHIEYIDCLYSFINELPFDKNLLNNIFLQCKYLKVPISHLSVVKQLINNSENVNFLEQGQTPIDLAKAGGHQDTLDILRSLDVISVQNKNSFFSQIEMKQLERSHIAINNIEREKQTFIDLLTPICEKVRENGNSENVQELISLLPDSDIKTEMRILYSQKMEEESAIS